MPDEKEKTCASCGAPLKEDASFCTTCGAAVAAPVESAAAAATPPPPPPGTPIPPPTGAPISPTGIPGMPVAGTEVPPAPGIPPMAPPKRSKAPLIVGIVGGLLVIAGIVVLVLFLTVWKGAGGGTDDPIALAEKYVSSLEKGDVDAYMDCFEPGYFSMEDNPLLEGMGMDVKELIEMSLEMAEIRFENWGLELVSEKGDKATVETTSGTLTVSVMGFEEDVDLADDPLEFVMVKQGGRWYLTEDPMPGMLGTDYDFNTDEQLPEDMNMEDYENLLPEDMNIEDFMDLIPEDINWEDLSPEELEQMLEDMQQWLQDEGIPQEESTSV